MLLQMAESPSSARPNDIPAHVYTMLSSSIHQSMDTWVLSHSVVDEAAVSRGVHISLGDSDFNSFR